MALQSFSHPKLSQVRDVTITNPQANEALIYNGSNWINSSITTLGTISGMLHVVDDTDSASVEVLRLSGLRATPTAGDAITQSFYLANSAGDAAQFAVIKAGAETTTSNAKDGSLTFQVMVNDTLRDAIAMQSPALGGAARIGMAIGWSGLSAGSSEAGGPYTSGFTIGGTGESTFNMVRSVSTNALMGAGVEGDTYRRFLIDATGVLNWGSGAAARDANLYRSAADTLKTDDSLVVAALEIESVTDPRLTFEVGAAASGIDAVIQISDSTQGSLGWVSYDRGDDDWVFAVSPSANLAATEHFRVGRGGALLSVGDFTFGDALNLVFNSTTGTKIGTATSQKIAFYGSTPIVQPIALTAALNQITHTEPGAPDYAIQDMTSSSPFGFVTQDEANTALKVIKNLQVRVDELETKLQSLGLVA